jgi:Ca2+-binding RTX toxin-like protein
VNGGSGNDRINGGSGNDRINVRDGRRDVVNCGSGRDDVLADKVDVLRGCETIRLP